MEYDDLILHFRLQPFYKEAEAYQVSVRRSPVGYLGGAWLRRSVDQPSEKSRLTPAWAHKVSRKYQAFIARYWEAAQDDDLDFMASSGVISQHEVIQLGQEMFEALPWSVQEKLRLGLHKARQQGHGLRVILEFNETNGAAAEVAQLPWELLYDPGV